MFAVNRGSGCIRAGEYKKSGTRPPPFTREGNVEAYINSLTVHSKLSSDHTRYEVPRGSPRRGRSRCSSERQSNDNRKSTPASIPFTTRVQQILTPFPPPALLRRPEGRLRLRNGVGQLCLLLASRHQLGRVHRGRQPCTVRGLEHLVRQRVWHLLQAHLDRISAMQHVRHGRRLGPVHYCHDHQSVPKRREPAVVP